jgi:predicted DNA binding CopG/RHH family protein
MKRTDNKHSPAKPPVFKSIEQERKFWGKHDSTRYVDWSKAKSVTFPNLKPTLKSISIRLPKSMLDDLKMLANKRDIAYQSLMKIYLSKMIEIELKQ